MVWHYTKGVHLPKIIASGEIRPATVGVGVGERPIVWFSTNPRWEETASPGRIDDQGQLRKATLEKMEVICAGRARIAVDDATAPYDWYYLKRAAGIKTKTAQGLETAAIRDGASPKDWRGTFDSVPREKWVSVEVFRNGAWVPFEDGSGGKGSDGGATDPAR
jgi:hypothetical protein